MKMNGELINFSLGMNAKQGTWLLDKGVFLFRSDWGHRTCRTLFTSATGDQTKCRSHRGTHFCKQNGWWTPHKLLLLFHGQTVHAKQLTKFNSQGCHKELGPVTLVLRQAVPRTQATSYNLSTPSGKLGTELPGDCFRASVRDCSGGEPIR